MTLVTIHERIAPGKVLCTDARFITPEELRAEQRRELHEERMRQGTIPPGGHPTACHERRKEGTA